MREEIIIPNLGLTMDEAKIAEWLKEEGELVEAGEPVMAIETDKTTMEVESPAKGYLHIIGRAGETHAVTGVVGWVAGSREDYEAGLAEGEEDGGGLNQGHFSTDPMPVEAKSPEALDRPGAKEAGGRRRISPFAWKLATKHGLDIEAVEGSGPKGRIVKRDVLAAIEGEAKLRVSPLARMASEEYHIDLHAVEGSGPHGRIMRDDVLNAMPKGSGIAGELKRLSERRPITGMRRVIFDHMHRSLQQSAQLSFFMEADAEELMRARRILLEAFKAEETNISYNAMLLKILSHALRAYPILNASVTGDEISLWDSVNIGVAMDVDEGLVVPVIRDVDTKGLLAIQGEMDVLIDKARSRRLLPDDMKGGTFTLTSLGHLDIAGFTPILNEPEVGILGVGKIMEKSVACAGNLKAGWRIMLSLTVDHRIVDGAVAARFLRHVKVCLEQPYRLLG